MVEGSLSEGQEGRCDKLGDYDPWSIASSIPDPFRGMDSTGDSQAKCGPTILGRTYWEYALSCIALAYRYARLGFAKVLHCKNATSLHDSPYIM